MTPTIDTSEKCPECDGRGVDPWGGTCLLCGGQGRYPFREWGEEDDPVQDIMNLHDETMQKLKAWIEGSL